jgi:predicted AlkP superfamily pyrophosphatase or phosphodiesterase
MADTRRRSLKRPTHPKTFASVILIVAIAAGLRASTAAPATPPALVVLIVVDQMRADYVDHFTGAWNGGFKRMVTQGAWFTRAAYPYQTTLTCAGHATISTGAFPHTHGVFQNAWWDREQRRMMTCTQDPNAVDIGYGIATTGGDSAYRLQVPTFTDLMRTGRKSRVVAVSLKARSAIMLAGHGGDAVAWLTDALDGWETSKVYSETPVPEVKAFIDANPITADLGKTWERARPASSYTGPDDGVGEAPPAGWTTEFPHRIGSSGQIDKLFFAQWELSPFANAYLGRFAAALVESMQLGARGTTDVLAVSFSSPDLVGHSFGPRSHEIQDIYARLDTTLGTLFDALDAKVGKDRWVAALTADHGVTPIPEQLAAEGKDAGRINVNAMYTAIEEALHGAFTAGRHVSVISTNDIYFEPGVYDKIRGSRELTAKVLGAIERQPGVHRVFLGEEIRDGAKSKDAEVRAAALSYFQGRSGDIVYAIKPGWMISSAGTTHGSATPDDQRVPILFLGAGIKPGKYDEASTPADVTPTLASMVGLSMPRAEGHPLSCVQ